MMHGQTKIKFYDLHYSAEWKGVMRSLPRCFITDSFKKNTEYGLQSTSVVHCLVGNIFVQVY